jgi:hypothetical protein
MFKIVKATIMLFAVLGIVAVLAIGTKACNEFKSYSDNLSSYSEVLDEMSDNEEEASNMEVAAIMA